MTHCYRFILLALFISSTALAQSSQPVESPGPGEPVAVPPIVYGADGKKYQIYVEQMPGETWDDKIRNAINRACDGGDGAEIILPPRHIPLTRTIMLWRQRKSNNVDTRCEDVQMRDLRQVWASMKGQTKSDLLRGITLRGAPGVTVLLWQGGENQVVIDMPAPWHITVKDLSIDGNNTEGLVGMRYRAGWEFGVNGGKQNTFKNIDIKRADVGIDVGGPFAPDLVASTFHRIGINACRIGMRFVGGNVAEQWVENSMSGSCWEANFKLISFQGRVVRSIKEKNEPTDLRVFKDADDNEIFLEQIPKACFKKHVRRKEHPDVPGSVDYHWVGGGGPTVFFSNMVIHNSFANAWVFDTNWATIRVQHIRCEGAAGVLRSSKKGMRNLRFNDVLIDVNATTTGNSSGYVIQYEKAGPIHFIGGVFEGPIGLGSNAVCYAIGTRFHNRGRKMNAYLHEGVEVPAESFFQPNGKTRLLPHRRKPGISVSSGVHEKIGFVQLPDTTGMRVHQMHEQHPMTVTAAQGKKSLHISLSDLARQKTNDYRVAITPNWRAGAVWVEKKQPDGFELHFDEPAPKGGGRFDITITRAGHAGELHFSPPE